MPGITPRIWIQMAVRDVGSRTGWIESLGVMIVMSLDHLLDAEAYAAWGSRRFSDS